MINSYFEDSEPPELIHEIFSFEIINPASYPTRSQRMNQYELITTLPSVDYLIPPFPPDDERDAEDEKYFLASSTSSPIILTSNDDSTPISTLDGVR
jgi:hypothetical protein